MVHAGTYNEGQLNVTQQNLLLRGAPGEAMPTVVSSAGQYSNAVVVNADGITVQGLELMHQSGDRYGYGIGDGNAGAAHSGWTVENCLIHDMRSAVWNNKMSSFAFQNNEVYNNYSKRLYLEATESFTCTNNFFHSATRTSGQGVIWWGTGNDPTASGDTTIAYHYISGGRAAIVIEGSSDLSPLRQPHADRSAQYVGRHDRPVQPGGRLFQPAAELLGQRRQYLCGGQDQHSR